MVAIILFWGCGNDKSCDKISRIFANKTKTNEEFNQLLKLLKRNKSCSDSLLIKNGIISENVLNESKLRDFYFNAFETVDYKTQNIKVNIFLENSASMWGYFEGATECEKVMSKIIIHSGHFFGKEDLKFSFISDSIYDQSSKDQVLDFVSKIEPSQLKVGDYRNTQISDIIKTVINKTNKDNFSVLITDCIYSQQAGISKIDKVNYEWTLIEDAFLSKLKERDISVLVNKYNSNYKGYYYSLDKINDKEIINQVGFNNDFFRPYYVICIGETTLMRDALKVIDFKEYPGYQYSYFITQPKSSDNIDYRILNTYKIGNFKPDKKDIKTTIVDASKEKRGQNKDKFMFTIAANMGKMGIENDYLIDESKYKISSDYNIEVSEITEEMKEKDPVLGSYTHLLSLICKANIKEESIKISLKRQTPSWVLQTNSDSDIRLDSLAQTQTRGFKYLIEGIESAFDKAQKTVKRNEDLKYYFTLNVNIKI